MDKFDFESMCLYMLLTFSTVVMLVMVAMVIMFMLEVLLMDKIDFESMCLYISPDILIMILTIMLVMTIIVSMITEMTMMMTMCFANHRGFGPLPKVNSISVSWIPHHGCLIEI